MHYNVAAFDQRNSFGQLALDRAELALHLPTVKVCTVVLNGELKIHFWRARSSGLGPLVLGLWSWAFGLGPLVLGLWSWAFGLGPLVLGLWSWAFGLLTQDLPSAHCLLLTAYCLLLTAYRLSCFRA